MRPQKVLDIEILAGLTKVFRSKGYDGASLAELAEATGLKKASLYHRFPGGKQEMAAAVLSHIEEWVSTHIFQVLDNKEKEPRDRLKDGLTGIRTLYNGGNEVCIFRALSMESGLELFEKQIANGLQEWIGAFENIGTELGFSTSIAQSLALQTLIDIQGSLIVTKGLSEISIFENTLQKIENNYLNN